jgi:phosphodiesterase/alkaline phosphatase D-like protein
MSVRHSAEVTKRRRVFQTAGLTASAAVLALSLQAAAQAESEGPPPSSYGDATILDPDDTGSAADLDGD